MVLLIRNVINTYVNVNKYRLVNICGPGLERMSVGPKSTTQVNGKD
jgi:hypothetical protein